MLQRKVMWTDPLRNYCKYILQHSDLYMESFEEEALDTCPLSCMPRVWKRYVDDTFIIVPISETDKLLKHMNSLEPTIQFTSEIECEGR